MQMKQLNDPIFIISFGGDKSASAANSMKDTQTRYYSGVGIGNTTGRPSGNARGTGFGGDKSLSKAFCTWSDFKTPFASQPTSSGNPTTDTVHRTILLQEN